MRYAKLLAIPTLVVAAAFLLWTQFAYGNGWTWIPVLIAAVAALVMVAATQVQREASPSWRPRSPSPGPWRRCSRCCSRMCFRRPLIRPTT